VPSPLGIFASGYNAPAGGFNPLTQVTALHAMWAGDPSWSNPGDGNAVTSWRNESGGGDPAAAGAARPIYRATVAGLGNKPAIEFDTATQQDLYVDVADTAQVFKLVVVALASTVSGNPMIVGNAQGAANGLRIITTGTDWRLNWGNSVSGGTPDTNGHVLRVTLDGVSSQLWVDEVSQFTGNAGTQSLTALLIGAGATATPVFSNWFDGYIAFVAYYAGATSDGDLTTLCNDLKSHYGL
jgi:hypothetical protein